MSIKKFSEPTRSDILYMVIWKHFNKVIED